VSDALDTIRQTPEYQASRKQLADREWRIDNLFTIKNADGIAVPFKRNEAQRQYSGREWFRDTILKSRKLGFCHDPSMRVLTADLRWVTVDDLKVGQEIVSVDENIPGGKGHHRRMRRAMVEAKRDVYETAYRLTMSNGESLIATGQHRYLCKRKEYSPETAWRAVQDMKIGQSIRFITKPWDDPTYEDGWMGGFIDGEGSFAARSVSAGINVAQTENAAFARAQLYLGRRDYNYRVETDDRSHYRREGVATPRKTLHKLCVGRMNEIFRLIGQCRPARFIGIDWWDGREMPGKKSGDAYAQVVGIENLGVRRMVDIQTSTKTFICEGFVSHNSTFISIRMLDTCLFASNTTCGVIDQTLDDATAKISMARFAYERMPVSLKQGMPLIVDNQHELKWANGSKIVAGTSYRGDTPQMLHISEYGPISAKSPLIAKEIKTGTIESVPINGKIWVESTAKGTSGEFYDLVNAGQQLQASGQGLTQRDFRLHFFNWAMNPTNRLPINLVHIPADQREYFEELRIKHGIITDGQQQAWYVKTREFLGPDDMRSEHPSIPEECFFASLEGAYFKTEMNAARRDKRVGLPVPHDPTRPVHSAWDLGLDGNLIVIFFQTDGVRHRIIDCAQGEHSGLSDGIRIVKDRNANRGYTMGKHYAPHDIQVRDFSDMTGVTAKTRKEIAAEHGIDFIVVARVADKADAIEAARSFINSCWFDADHAGNLVEALDNYSKSWNRTTMQWMPIPAKNGYDHFADALMQAALGLQPDRVYKRDQALGKRKGSHWSA